MIKEGSTGEDAACVGVLMAVYARDSAVAFTRALSSVLSQVTTPRIAVRLFLGVDGPLPPELEQVLRLHESRLFRIVRNERSLGLAATLNRLIAERTDEQFFFRMDADDWSLPGRFQIQLAHLAAHPDIDILGTDIVEVDAVRGTRRVVHFADGPEHARAMICRRVPVAHPTVCFRSRVFDLVPTYPNQPGNEDVAMWFECMRAGLRFDNVKSPMLEFTLAPGFWKRRGLSKSLGEFRAYFTGIISLWGLNWRLLFPFARLLFRLMPEPVKRWAYARR